MSSYGTGYILPKNTGKGSPNFIFIAIAIIIVFVVLYYSYNFLFDKIGAATPIEVITSALDVSTLDLTKINNSFTPPYEGGDYTVSFWMYVNGTVSGALDYRKHIVSIGGDRFSTLVIALDGSNTNNLIVRTHTADGSSLSVDGAGLTTTSGGSRAGSMPNYYCAGTQCWYNSGNSGTYGCYTQMGNPGSIIAGSSNCITPDAITRRNTAGDRCTSGGRIRGGVNIGFDIGCNPCDGYWVTETGGSGSGSGSGSGTGTQIYKLYDTESTAAGTQTNICRLKCSWNCDSFKFAQEPSSRGSNSGTSGSDKCTWSGNINVARENCINSFDGSARPSSTTSTTPSWAPTVSLSAGLMRSFFTQASTASGSGSAPCDVPEYDLQRWTHITVVLSGKITDVYMNGKLARSCIGATYFKVDANPKLRLLNYANGFVRFDGKLANLNLYSVALNPAQIYDMYTKGPTEK